MQDIKPLLVFAAVLEHGSMNAAAAALGMTPSAVSQHINRLETLHGIKLLNRSTRSLAPTDAGRALGEYCRRLAATLADTRTVIDNLKTEPVGELRISLTSSVISSHAFQTAFSRLQTEFPKIRPVLNFSDTLDKDGQAASSGRRGLAILVQSIAEIEDGSDFGKLGLQS